MKKLENLITNLESKIQDHDLTNPGVSKGSVGWHIEHSLLTLNLIIDVLGKSNPEDYKSKFDFRRILVMTTGKIPRGRVKAPGVVQPNVNFNTETLRQHIQLAREKMKSIDSLKEGNFFTHPFLGDFKLKPALKFLKIHTKHHLNIIDDIIKSKSS